MSGININISRVAYLTCDDMHANVVRAFVSCLHFDADLTAPSLFECQVLSTPFDLFFRIDELSKDRVRKLLIIIDYQSIMEQPKERLNDYFCVIRDTVLCFPEIDFFFDKTRWKENSLDIWSFFKKTSLGSSIIQECGDKVDFGFHSFRFLPDGLSILSFVEIRDDGFHVNEEAYLEIDKKDESVPWNPLKSILLGKKNLFDASNLRYLFKRHKADELRLNRNFKDVQDSRYFNLALCVEEERGQSLFNSLALFLNGYRVRPITSADELKGVNKNFKKGSEQDLKHLLILRDYDLQFPDASTESSDIKSARLWNFDPTVTNSVFHCLKESFKIGKLKENGWNPVRVFRNSVVANRMWHYQVRSDYWSNLQVIHTYFVSKGYQDQKGKTRMKFRLPGKQPLSSIEERLNHLLILPGLNKPVSGIYSPFQDIPDVKERYRSIRMEESRNPITTKRISADGHSVPLDLYNLVKSMVERAEAYYDDSRFVHAVIVANEAIEIMNGFHQALTLRAYRCQALAENAVAANVLGTDEEDLAIDTEFRLKRIIGQVLRLSSLGDEKGRKSQNTLNQIFNDIRLFCQTKEHFLAENVVIREIGHLNEGFFYTRG